MFMIDPQYADTGIRFARGLITKTLIFEKQASCLSGVKIN